MNILAVRVGRVGDTVMMTPALTALIHYYPDASVTLLTSPVGKQLLKDFHPNIVDNWSWNRSGVLKPYTDKTAIRKKLQHTHFDKVFCFDTSPRIAELFHDIKTEFYWHRGSPELKHCSKSYLDFVAESCNEPVLDIYNTLPVNADDKKLADQILDNIGITAEDTLIMFHPTFSGFSKSGFRKKQARLRKLWPTRSYGELGIKLSQTLLPDDSSPKILMVLLPDEISYGQEIVAHSDNTIKLLQSQSTFETYKAILKRANLLVTPDSGPMHVASALGTRIIAFFSMKDPGDCGPYMTPDKFTILRTEDTEAPEKGVASINVDVVLSACIDQLTKEFEH